MSTFTCSPQCPLHHDLSEPLACAACHDSPADALELWPDQAVASGAYRTVVQPAGCVMIATPDEAASRRPTRGSAQAQAGNAACAQLLLTPDGLRMSAEAGCITNHNHMMLPSSCAAHMPQAAAGSLTARSGEPDACRDGDEELGRFVVPRMSNGTGERELALLWKRRMPHKA